jgi:hypothetical protein
MPGVQGQELSHPPKQGAIPAPPSCPAESPGGAARRRSRRAKHSRRVRDGGGAKVRQEPCFHGCMRNASRPIPNRSGAKCEDDCEAADGSELQGPRRADGVIPWDQCPD